MITNHIKVGHEKQAHKQLFAGSLERDWLCPRHLSSVALEPQAFGQLSLVTHIICSKVLRSLLLKAMLVALGLSPGHSLPTCDMRRRDRLTSLAFSSAHSVISMINLPITAVVHAVPSLVRPCFSPLSLPLPLSLNCHLTIKKKRKI